MNFYKHYLGDYARATGHLSVMEHGAYRLMLDHFYGTCRPLPGNKKALYRLIRAETEAEKRAVDSVALRYWRTLPAESEPLFALLDLETEDERRALRVVITEWTEVGGLINVRALGEIVKTQIIAEKNKEIAIYREERRRQMRQQQVAVGGRT